MSILHKDICSCPMRYAGSPDELCDMAFVPDQEYEVYATENRLTGTVMANISPRGMRGILGWYVTVPYADIDVFYKIWKPIF